LSTLACAGAFNVACAEVVSVDSKVAVSSTTTRNVTLGAGEALRTPYITIPVPATAQIEKAKATQAKAGIGPVQVGVGRAVPALNTSARTTKALTVAPQRDGGNILALSIHAGDAQGLRLGVLFYKLPARALVRVHAPGSTQAVQFTGAEINALIEANIAEGATGDSARTWWGPVVEGPAATLNIYLPPGVLTSEVLFEVPLVSHLFAFGSSVEKDLAPRVPSKCFKDVPCESRTDKFSRASVMLTFTKDNGETTQAGSGTLVKDDLNSGKPYILTARHIFNGTDARIAARSLFVTWFHRSPACNSTPVPVVTAAGEGAVVTYMSEMGDNDTALLLLNAPAPDGVEPIEVRKVSPAVGESGISISYPVDIVSPSLTAGEFLSSSTGQKFASGKLLDFLIWGNLTSEDNWVRVKYVEGSAYSGSSGSGIIGTDSKIIGTLSGTALPFWKEDGDGNRIPEERNLDEKGCYNPMLYSLVDRAYNENGGDNSFHAAISPPAPPSPTLTLTRNGTSVFASSNQGTTKITAGQVLNTTWAAKNAEWMDVDCSEPFRKYIPFVTIRGEDLLNHADSILVPNDVAGTTTCTFTLYQPIRKDVPPGGITTKEFQLATSRYTEQIIVTPAPKPTFSLSRTGSSTGSSTNPNWTFTAGQNSTITWTSTNAKKVYQTCTGAMSYINNYDLDKYGKGLINTSGYFWAVPEELVGQTVTCTYRAVGDGGETPKAFTETITVKAKPVPLPVITVRRWDNATGRNLTTAYSANYVVSSFKVGQSVGSYWAASNASWFRVGCGNTLLGRYITNPTWLDNPIRSPGDFRAPADTVGTTYCTYEAGGPGGNSSFTEAIQISR
jgi:hypothetical protein